MGHAIHDFTAKLRQPTVCPTCWTTCVAAGVRAART